MKIERIKGTEQTVSTFTGLILPYTLTRCRKVRLNFLAQSVRAEIYSNCKVSRRGQLERYPVTHQNSNILGTEEISKFWVPMGTGYQGEEKFWVPVATGYRREEKLWVPATGQKKFLSTD